MLGMRAANTKHTSGIFSQPGNFQDFLRQRADILNGSDRHWKNCLHRHAAEISTRATLHQYHPKVALLLLCLEPVR